MAFDGAVDFGVVLIFSRDFMWHRDLFNWCIKVGPGVFGYDQLMQGPLEACSQSTRLPGARHSLHAICATWELFPSVQLYCLGSELGGCEEVAHGLLHERIQLRRACRGIGAAGAARRAAWRRGGVGNPLHPTPVIASSFDYTRNHFGSSACATASS